MSSSARRCAQRIVLWLVLPVSLGLALPAAALAVAPDAGTDSATAVTTTGATLNATVNPEGEMTQYQFDYAQDSSTWCQHQGSMGSPAGTTTPGTLAGTDSNVDQVSTAATGLTPNTGYCFEVVASNTDGPSAGGFNGFTTLMATPTVTTEPASSITGTSATLNGTDNAEGQSGGKYRFDWDYTRDEWCQSGGASGTPAGKTTTTPLSSDTGQPVSAAISGLTPGDSICFAVEANPDTNSAVLGTPQVTFTTTPMVITTASTTSVVNGGATLNGSINDQGQPGTTYYFDLGTPSSGACSGSQATALTPFGYTDSNAHAVSGTLTGLTPSTTYCDYVVTSNSSYIFTDSSNFATFTTPPPATLTVTTSGQVGPLVFGGVTSPDYPNYVGGTEYFNCYQDDPGTGCQASYVEGTTVVTLTAEPANGGGVVGHFDGWSGACSGTQPTCTVAMTADKTVGARFSRQSGGPSGPSGPSSSAVGKAVSSALGVTAKIKAILKAGGYQAGASALSAGKLTITWSTGSGTHGTRSVTVASGSKSFSKAGKAKLKIKLTRAGKALLKRSKHVKLTASGVFKPTHGNKVTKTRTLKLNR